MLWGASCNILPFFSRLEDTVKTIELSGTHQNTLKWNERTRAVPEFGFIISRQDVGKTYLTASSSRQDRKSADLITDYARYCWSVLSDEFRAINTPLVNICTGLPNMLPPLLTVVDCNGHLAEGDFKDGLFLAGNMKCEVQKNHPPDLCEYDSDRSSENFHMPELENFVDDSDDQSTHGNSIRRHRSIYKLLSKYQVSLKAQRRNWRDW